MKSARVAGGMLEVGEAGIADADVRSTLECGGLTPPWSSSSALCQGGVKPPHSKVLRTAIFMRVAVSNTAASDVFGSRFTFSN
jgi:hypothetical protein